jgi:hypothetical protein
MYLSQILSKKEKLLRGNANGYNHLGKQLGNSFEEKEAESLSSYKKT